MTTIRYIKNKKKKEQIYVDWSMHDIQPHAKSTSRLEQHWPEDYWTGYLLCLCDTIREFRTISVFSVLVGIWTCTIGILVLFYVHIHLVCSSEFVKKTACCQILPPFMTALWCPCTWLYRLSCWPWYYHSGGSPTDRLHARTYLGRHADRTINT